MVKRLGKGLDAIIAAHSDADSGPSGVAALAISQIKRNPHQPRKEFDREALAELSDSIREKGVITPITVRITDDKYMLVAGERRLRAAKLAGLKDIPAYIIDVTDDADMMEVALIENIQRENLNPIEEAEAYAVLRGKFNLSQEAIAQAVGKKRVTVTNALRLLKLPLEIRRSLRNQEITAGHGRALLGLKTAHAQKNLWQRILSDDLSVRGTETAVKFVEGSGRKKTKKRATRLAPQVKALEDELVSLLGTKVKLRPGKDGGNISISYYSNDDLERLLELFRSLD